VIGQVSGVKFFVLNPSENAGAQGSLSSENDNSVVLKLVYKNFSCIFCGDASSGAMRNIISYDSFLRSDVMKAPHHGGGLGDEEIASDFFIRVSPKVCILSAGDMYKRVARPEPRSNFITYLNSICYETRKYGAIDILSDGSSPYKVKTYGQKN
jgi:competence protein ComEC